MFLKFVLFILFVPFLLFLVLLLRYKRCKKSCKSQRKLYAKTAIVTGASAGIGKETAFDFARRGARVILACRNVKKAQRVADLIISETKNKNVVVYEIDTSDLSSVKNFARKILQNEKRLDILVNNAGISGNSERKLTKDGLEMTMATNYYGHFLLTFMLIDLLKKSAPSRVVNVSSELHFLCFHFDPQNLNFERGLCNNITTYAQSKLCNVLFTFELAEKLKGTGVTVNALNPGLVKTEIFDKSGKVFMKLPKLLSVIFGNSCKVGAQTSIHLAVCDEVENTTGKYFEFCHEAWCSRKSRDRLLSKKLWDTTIKDLKLNPDQIRF